MHFQLVTLKGTQLDTEAIEVLLPTSAGRIGILKDHMPLISRVTPGIIEVKLSDNKTNKEYATLGGIVEIDGTTVRLLADDVSTIDNVNEPEAIAAVEKAQKLISEAKTKVDLDEAKRLLEYSNLRLGIAKSKRKH